MLVPQRGEHLRARRASSAARGARRAGAGRGPSSSGSRRWSRRGAGRAARTSCRGSAACTCCSTSCTWRGAARSRPARPGGRPRRRRRRPRGARGPAGRRPPRAERALSNRRRDPPERRTRGDARLHVLLGGEEPLALLVEAVVQHLLQDVDGLRLDFIIPPLFERDDLRRQHRRRAAVRSSGSSRRTTGTRAGFSRVANTPRRRRERRGQPLRLPAAPRGSMVSGLGRPFSDGECGRHGPRRTARAAAARRRQAPPPDVPARRPPRRRTKTDPPAHTPSAPRPTRCAPAAAAR